MGCKSPPTSYQKKDNVVKGDKEMSSILKKLNDIEQRFEEMTEQLKNEYHRGYEDGYDAGYDKGHFAGINTRQKWSEQAKRGKEHRDEIEKMLEERKNTKSKFNPCDNCEYKGLGGCTRQAKGYSDLCIDFSEFKPKQTKDDYVDAIVKVRVPKWQIGEKVNLYFKDTMSMDGICEADKK